MVALKTVGTYEAKTKLPALLRRVAKGEEIIISRRGRAIAKLSPMTETVDRTKLVRQMRALRASLKPLPKGETAGDLINAGRRI
jgi:prevent-host-death family protein